MPYASKELSGITAGKQDNSGFSFYRLDDSLLHNSQGNAAHSSGSSPNNKKEFRTPSKK